LIVILMQLWQCKSILFAAYLKDDQMTCVLDQLEVSSSSLELYEMQILWNKTFDECILICNLLHLENKCNAIKYYQTLMKCYLLAAPINSTTTETQHQSYKIFFIYGCLKASFPHFLKYMTNENLFSGSYYLHEIGNYSMLVSGGTFISVQLEILNLTIITERRPTVDSIRSKIIENNEKASTGDCVVTCYARSWHNGCNAVVYNPKTSLCTLLKHETPKPPITFTHHGMTLMLLLHLVLPWDVKVNSVRIEATHNISYELRAESGTTKNRQSQRRNNPPPMQYYLKETGEICVLEFYNATQLRGFYPIETLENVENIKSCIFACRLRYSSYICLAINYTMKKQCTLFRQDLRHKIYNVESQSLFAEILFCEPGTLADEIFDF
ncbi:hypothetical protein T4B_8170, partial [Trichinella pseudospiralis]